MTAKPSKRTFDNPTARLHCKTNLPFGFAYLFQAYAIGGFRIIDNPLFVASINPYAFASRNITTNVGEKPFSTFTVLAIGGVYQYAYHKPKSINQQGTFAPVHLLFPRRSRIRRPTRSF